MAITIQSGVTVQGGITVGDVAMPASQLCDY